MKSRITISKRIFLTILTCCLFAVSINAQTSPVVVSTVPAHNATNVARSGGLITATFDQPIQKGLTGKLLTIWYADTETVYNSFTISNVEGFGMLTISGNTLTLPYTLPYNTNMYISLENGLVKNSNDQYNATYGYASEWFFTTESDTYNPILTSMTPPDGFVGVWEDSNLLSYSFNENVQAGSGNVIVRRVDNDAIILNVDVAIPSNVIVSGSSFTIVSTSSTFDYSTEYYVEFPSGVIEDLLGNPFEGIGSPPLADHNFTMRDEPADTFPPTVSSLSPPDNATGVDVNTDFVITFNEDVQIGTGSFYVRRSGTGAIIYQMDVSNASVTGSTATFTLPDNLFRFTNYYIWIDAGAFTDLAGNDYAGTSTPFVWNFTTGNASDVNPPIAATFTPLDNTTDVLVSTNLSLNFNEAVQLVGDAVLKNFGGSVIPSTSTVSGSALTINPTSDLALNTSYYVEIAYGAIRDLAGNSFVGFNGNSTWNFTTEATSDTTPPVAVTFTPADNATDVGITTNLTLLFDEAIQLNGNAVLKNIGGSVIASTSTVSGSTLTINPTSNLAYNTQFYVEIANGVIKDIAGNSYAGFLGNSAWNFTTEVAADVTPPLVSSLSPFDNATGVAIGSNLVVNFNENVQTTGSGVIQILNGSGTTLETFVLPNANVIFSGSTLTINPTSDFSYSSDFYMFISDGSVEDLAGNNFAGIFGTSNWNFTTEVAADTTAPVAITFTPADNATNVSIATNLTLLFDEAIQLNGSAVLKNIGGSVIPSTSTVSGSTLTINPTSDLANNTQYYVEIANGVIKDIAGNNYAGFSGNSTWNFTTETVFSIVSFSPANNATDVALGQAFTITFNEPIQKVNTGTFQMFDADTDVQLGVNFFLPPMVTISGNSATINYPTGYISAGQSVYFVLSSATITNMSGVAWSGLSANDYTLHFAVGDTTPPVATTFTPLNNATDISTTDNLTLLFDETIQLTASAVLKNIDGFLIPSMSTVSGSTLTINPTSDLANNTQYYVEIANGAIKDLSGNSYAGFSGDSFWNFTTDLGNTTTWNGTMWDNGLPNNTMVVIIDGNYTTSDIGLGSFEALELNVNLGAKLTVSAGDYVSVVDDIVVDGTLEILNQGTLVQINDLATVTNNGAIEVEKITSVFSNKDFSIMSSPMSNEAREGVYNTAALVLRHLTNNFNPHPDVEIDFPLAENFADDNGDNWLIHTGTLTVGEGYLVKPFTSGGSGTYSTIYNEGTLNNGTINFTALYGDNQNDSPNVLGNPYASAVDAAVLISTNTVVDAIYYWEHITDPSYSYPGYSSYNYDMGDISMYNLSGGIAAANAGGGEQASNQFIPSGQGFSIKANAAGTVTFNNAMRLVDQNDNYRTNESIDRLYLKVSNETYHLNSSTLIAFTVLATDGFDNNFDSKRLATPVSIYSLNSERELGIQGRSVFNEDQIIRLGFSTQVEENQEYTISIGSVEGELINQATIYLKDNLLNTVTNLSEMDYSFTSNQGSQTDRFVIVFANETLDTNENGFDTISIYPNPTKNVLNVNSPLANIISIEVYDLRGRKVGAISIDYQHSYQLDMSSLKSAMYFVKITTASGTLTKRIIRE